MVGVIEPIIEIAAQYQGPSGVYGVAHIIVYGLVLLAAVVFTQIQMCAQDYQRLGPIGWVDLAMQHAAVLHAVYRDVDIVFRVEWEAAQYGIAVVAAGVDGIFAIAAVQSKKFTEKLVLGLVGKIVELDGAFQMLTLHLLQHQNVG